MPGTKLPHQLAAGLLQVHPEPGGAVLQVQQHEGGQPGQQEQGGPLPGSRGQGQAEIFLDWRSGQERPDQLAVRQEIQRRGLVPHWRVRDLTQSSPLSLAEECRDSALIGPEDHSVPTPALLCHKEPARHVQTQNMYPQPAYTPHPPNPKSPSRGLWMPELVLYGIRELGPAIPRV